MPGQRGSEKRQRNKVFTMRLDDAEKARLDDIAEHSDASSADVIRRMLVHDHSRILPSRELTQQIMAVGNNVNQIARALNGINGNNGQTPGLRPMLAKLDDQRLQLQKVVRDLTRIRRDMDKWR